MEKKRILVVEDDDFFREAISDLLKKNYNVSVAPNGKAAIEQLSLQDFDLVLTDIQMPILTGLELLEWSKKNKPLPFVIMTGFSMALETKTAFELGATGFISKPFKHAELFSVLEAILKSESNLSSAAKEKIEFCKVSIDEFVSKPQIDFDVYIKLSENKSVKLANKGEMIPVDRVKLYKEKGVTHLHILKEDFSKLVEFNINVTKIIKDRDDVSLEKKINFIKFTGEVLMEKIFVVGVDKQSFFEAQTFLTVSMDVISESDEHVNILTLLNKHSDHVYAHSLGVAMYSVMVAKKMFFESSSVLFKLMTAGLYHDIGKKEIDREILDKPRHLHNKEERRIFETHVVRGQEILMRINGVSEDVAHLVSEHHEDMVGQGYPLSKKRSELHPLSKILQACNIFMELVLSPTNKGMTAINAVSYMEKVYDNRVDKNVLAAIKTILEK